VVLHKRQNEEYQVSLNYEFTKEKLKELHWSPCGKRPRIVSDGEISESVDSSSKHGSDVGNDVEMDEVVDSLGKDAVDAVNLFPGLAGHNITGMSVTMKQLPADETDVEDDDSVLPHRGKLWPKDVPKAPKSYENRHLYYAS
jgi:hypothetical protein